MFSNRVQVAQVCRVLTAGIVQAPLFTSSGPTEQARALQRHGADLPGGDRALLELAFWLWDGEPAPRLSAVVELVDRRRLRLVGLLLVALADGSAAIERFVRGNGGSAGDA